MKKILFIFLMTLCWYSCSEEETSQPEPQGTKNAQQSELMELLMRDTYWKEEIHFLYLSSEYATEVSETENIFDCYEWDGGNPRANEVGLNWFYVRDAETGAVRQFEDRGAATWGYYDKRYRVCCDDARQTIRMETDDELLSAINALSNLDLKVLSASEEQIVLETPIIKPYIEEHWDWDGLVAPNIQGPIYVGLRIYWTRVDTPYEQAVMSQAQPLD